MPSGSVLISLPPHWQQRRRLATWHVQVFRAWQSALTSAWWLQASYCAVTARTPLARMFESVPLAWPGLLRMVQVASQRIARDPGAFDCPEQEPHAARRRDLRHILSEKAMVLS
jgi:hypothetical protein